MDSFFRCQGLNYKDSLPSASIVICFYNEHFETLLRTVHSILDRTPSHLQEILLVDDNSDLGMVVINSVYSNLTYEILILNALPPLNFRWGTRQTEGVYFKKLARESDIVENSSTGRYNAS